MLNNKRNSVFIFKIHILSLKLTNQKGAKIDDVTG